ncbi:MAG TPA: SpoIIE family protein phosphatase, partial [Candidatus Lustribacter sp.]|nr:SpoIIE family protein phosphatase [Candidatus Lustribacter sp.]
MAFDMRAMENIATAPASRLDRVVAGWVAAGIAAGFALLVPFSSLRFAPNAAAVPALLSAGVLAQVLTAILFYVQYRVARQSQLAILSLAYASASLITLCYMLTFPGVFSATGMLDANDQTTPWLALLERETFGLFLIAFACADRFRWTTSRTAVRWMAAGVAAAVVLLIWASVRAPLPELVVEARASPFFNHVILPLNLVTAVVAVGLLAASGLRTVTQVWLAVVALLYVCQTVASSVLAGSRYTLGWYSGRGFVFGGASVLLAVFLVKINDVVVQLASRNVEGEQRYRSLAQRTQMRENFLAAAGDQLSASLDLQATLATIGEVLSWTIVRWSRVDLIDDDGRFANGGSSAVRRLAAILAGGEPVIERDLALLDAPALRGGAIVVPLVSGNVPLGTLTLAYDDPAHPDAEHLWIARDFGRRAAVALDHALRFERERTTADSFQRAMLPNTLPRLDNVTFSASYSAASESRRVGGDFYDAFVLPNGRVALTIGDVTGHGLEAAVIMGEIRQSLRAAASFEDAAPSEILDRASRLLVGSGRSVFVTAIFGVLDPRTGRFDYATAGHPSPIVYDGHTLRRLAGSGLPIGLRDGEGVDFSLVLPAACTIVLYTDGLIEFTRNLDEGEARLDAAIFSLNGMSDGPVAATIMKRALGDDAATDDIAILTATIRAPVERAAGDMRGWRFSSTDMATAVRVRHEVGELIGAWTGDAEQRYNGELAFGEMFANVVRHAPGPVDVRLESSPAGVDLSVSDRGGGFAGTLRPPDISSESG